MTVAFYKPYGVLSRFTPDGSSWKTLAAFSLPKNVFPVGRLDADSEGLLILTEDKSLVDRLLSPRRHHFKTYWVQVERIPSDEGLQQLCRGVTIAGEITKPARVKRIDDPQLPAREVPIRFRKNVPDCWIELAIAEGKNRQVRKMTAAIGHPTLRLHRASIGKYWLRGISPGEHKHLDQDELLALTS